MHYGLGPAFALGALAAYARLWYIWAVALRFRAWAPGVKYKSIFKFDSDFDVEVASRVARVWDEDGNLDPVAIELAETVIKARCRRAARAFGGFLGRRMGRGRARWGGVV